MGRAFLISIIMSSSWCSAQEKSIYGSKIYQKHQDLILAQFVYNVSTADVNITTASSGTVQQTNNMARLCSGTTAGGTAQIQSDNYISYIPGHQIDMLFSVAFINGGAANSTQWIGIFDDNDGIAVGYNGTTFSILYRKNNVDTIIAQNQFNGDTLNGAGSSGFILNPLTLNTFRLSYGWLGGSILQFQIQNTGGTWITFHTVRQPNSSTTPSFFNPQLPLRARVQQSGTTNVCLVTAGWDAALIRSNSKAGSRYFSTRTTITIPALSSGAELPILTLRNQATYQSKTNKTMLRIAGWGMVVNLNSGVTVRLRKDATITGSSAFTAIDSVNSIAAVASGGALGANGGTVQLIQPLLTASSRSLFFGFIPSSSFLPVQPGSTVTITMTTGILTVLGFAVTAIICWEELF